MKNSNKGERQAANLLKSLLKNKPEKRNEQLTLPQLIKKNIPRLKSKQANHFQYGWLATLIVIVFISLFLYGEIRQIKLKLDKTVQFDNSYELEYMIMMVDRFGGLYIKPKEDVEIE